ncbi:MAG: nucleotidyltransferase family protein [Verrucomicrobia bacterium]|nr:nucleotidyltransferase family protein [Verrucomicrobiota bacterium]MBI3869068.1 nucleotidyltransferase family protein [Verrucomicrobiota bacterium]
MIPPPRGPLLIDAPTVLILAGGLGTRLRSAVSDRPKVLADVGGRPFLAYWLETLALQGFQNVVLCTGYLSDHIERCFGDSYGPLKLRYSVESSPLGTGGAIRQALAQTEGSELLVLNGDSYCEVDLAEFWRDRARRRFPAAMALHYCADTRRFGRVTLTPENRVESFLEKSDLLRAGWINAGVYLLPSGWIREIAENAPASLERDLLPGWLTNGIYGFPSTGRFIDIGLPETLARAEEFFAASRRVAA